MVDEATFGPWGRFLLIGAGSVAVLITLLIIACFVTPGCLGYECIRKRKKEEKSVSLRYNGRPNENLKLNDISYRSWRLGSLYDNGSISEYAESHRDSIISNNVISESLDTSSTMNLIRVEEEKNSKEAKDFPTELTMSLQYLPPGEDNITGKLVIGIESVSNLPPKQYNCTLEPYVAFKIVKQSWTHRKQQTLHSFRTRGIRHTASPIFRETFVIADVKPNEIKDWILDLSAYDHDRYANHTELSTLRVPLKEAKKILTSPEKHMFNYNMKPSNKEFGDILLGISYLPTAQRLTINVMRLGNLKILPAVTNISDFNPYVKVLMMNGKTGRKIQKRKTKFLLGVAQPEFNETLTFDLTLNELDTSQFLIIVCSKTSVDEMVGNDHPSDSEGSVNSYVKSKDIFIGKVALGKGVRGPTERMHWFSVVQNPRKLVTVWHRLK